MKVSKRISKPFVLSLALELVIFGISAPCDAFNHAIYISVLEVLHDENEEVGQIRVKVFENDIGDAIFNAYGERLKKSPSGFENSAPLEKYLSAKIKLSINGQIINLSLDAHERLNDSIWLTFEFPCPSTWKTLNISADYLFELFPTQTNVVSILNQDEKQFAKLTLSTSEMNFTF